MLNGKKRNGSTGSPSRVKSRGGFSLAEVLMATGILALGMVFVAGLFPAAIYFTAVSTERTIGLVVADEAFAKIRLYGVDVNLPFAGGKLQEGGCANFLDVSGVKIEGAAMVELLYPSDPDINYLDKKYCWPALCRRVSGTRPSATLVQVTVFVCRLVGAGTTYPEGGQGGKWPMPVQVAVSKSGTYELTITNIAQRTFISAGSTIVENTTGRIYRVLSHNPAMPEQINLDRIWQGGTTGVVWVIPPPVGGGRQPCVGVFQKEMIF